MGCQVGEWDVRNLSGTLAVAAEGGNIPHGVAVREE
jgi:hypothetical protein